MRNNKKKVAGQEVNTLVVQEINQVNVDRTPKDVADMINSLRIAESIQMPNRSRLYDLFDTVWLDGHLTGIWGKRQSGACNTPITFVDSSGQKVEAVDELMKTNSWTELLKLIVDSKLWGLSGIEFVPGKVFAYEEIPRKHILIEKGLIKLNQNDQTGEDYTQNKFVWVIGKKRDLGLMLKCSFYALIKKGNFADWAQYSEIFGQPIRVVYYDAFDDKTRIQLKQVLDDAGSSLALMIPKQAKFEIMDGKTSNGDGQLQNRLKDACNNEMSVALLGNTETTTSDNGGSNAKAKEQGEQQDEITKDDIKFLLSQLNEQRFIDILASYGYPVKGGKFITTKELNPHKALAIVQVIAQVRSSGTPVDDDYVYEVTGIPKPKNYEELKAKAELKAASDPRKAEKEGKQPMKEDQDELADNVWSKIRTKLADFFDPAR